MNKNIYITAIAFALAAASLESCKSLYGDYSRPDTAVIDSTNVVRSELRSNDSEYQTAEWRSMFTDPQLQSLIEEGLQHNSDLKTAKLQCDEAAASLSAAKKALLPSVSASASGNISRYDGTTAKTYSIGPDISWEADIFGKLSNAKKMQAATLEESQAYAQAVQTRLIATIAEDYYMLLMYDAQVKVTEQTVKSWTEYISTEKALMEAGQATQADVKQAEASKSGAEITAQKLKAGITQLENTLCALIGRKPGTISRSTLDEQSLPSQISSGISLTQLTCRPDVRQAEAKLKKAFYATNKARSAFYPTLTLSGSAGWTNSGGAAVVNPGKILLQAAASLVQPIFNQGQNTANLKIAKAQQEEALTEWQQSLLNAGEEVNNALSQWQSSKKETELESQQVSQLQEALRSAEASMKYGSGNYLQVIVARQSLLSAQLDLLSCRYSQLESVVELYQAAGGGTE